MASFITSELPTNSSSKTKSKSSNEKKSFKPRKTRENHENGPSSTGAGATTTATATGAATPSSVPNFTFSSTGGRLVKPNKEDLDKLSNEIQLQITTLQNESKDIKKQIDKLLGARSGSKVQIPIFLVNSYSSIE